MNSSPTAVDKIMQLKTQLANARRDLRDERLSRFKDYVAKKFGRPLRKGDQIVVHWAFLDPGPLEVVDVSNREDYHPYVKVYPHAFLKKGYLRVPGTEYLLLRGALRGGRFATPEEIDGSAYRFRINHRKVLHDTAREAVNEIKSWYKKPNLETIEQGDRLVVCPKRNDIGWYASQRGVNYIYRIHR